MLLRPHRGVTQSTHLNGQCWPCDETLVTGGGFSTPSLDGIYWLPSKPGPPPHPASQPETEADRSAAACVAEVTGVLKVPGNEPTLSAAHRGETVLSIFIQSKTRQAKISRSRNKGQNTRTAAASR